ncbi:nuclear transport factor 2 family protein [Sphingopyxis sp.]|uniref:nuclear transport factor 2 family protein n=1 Tax=Sphingopyxis sp. TaxID=1908224 RepID=UPI002FCA750A
MPLDFARFALPCVAALLAAAPAHAAQASSPEQALEAHYVGGLRTGRVEELQKLFLPDGQFCTLPEDSSAPVGCKPFAEVLASWAARPDPSATGRILDRRDATPSMSAVTYELYFGGDRYIDQLLLYRTEAGWRIVAKTTAVQ